MTRSIVLLFARCTCVGQTHDLTMMPDASLLVLLAMVIHCPRPQIDVRDGRADQFDPLAHEICQIIISVDSWYLSQKYLPAPLVSLHKLLSSVRQINFSTEVIFLFDHERLCHAKWEKRLCVIYFVELQYLEIPSNLTKLESVVSYYIPSRCISIISDNYFHIFYFLGISIFMNTVLVSSFSFSLHANYYDFHASYHCFSVCDQLCFFSAI